MPAYLFITDDGTCVERVFTMTAAPRIGESFSEHGRRYTRIPSPCSIDPGYNRNMFPRVSDSLPRNLEGCPCDKLGRPIIRSKRHEREICARYGYVKD